MSEFWELVDEEFGRSHSRVLVRDHVIRSLRDRTPQAALDDGTDPREVWMALCDDLEVPEGRRWGAGNKSTR
jgi:Protein of unknown function (DUF3046)